MEKMYGISGKVKEFDNGYLIENNHAYYYIPKNCSNTTNTVVYAHGAGGSNSDYWENYLKSNNIDAIYAIPKDRLSYNNMHESYDMLSKDIDTLHQKLGIENDNMSMISHSSGGEAGLYWMAKNINDHPGLEPQTYIIIDPATESTSNAGFVNNLTHEKTIYKALKANHPTIIALEQSGSDVGASLPNYKVLGDAGANVIVLGMNKMSNYGGNAHDGIARYAFNQGMISFLSGESNFEDVFNKHVSVIYKYDSKNSKWEEVKLSDISGNLNEIMSAYSNFNSKGEYYSKVNFDDYANTVKSLQNLEMFSIPTLDTVSNDEKFVCTSMNEMRTNIKGTALVKGGCKSIGCQSTTIVPTCAENFLSDYFAVVLNLMDKISKETQNAVNISLGIIKTDEELSKAAEEMAGGSQKFTNTVYVPVYMGGSSSGATIANPTSGGATNANPTSGGTTIGATTQGTASTSAASSSSSSSSEKKSSSEHIELKPYSVNSLLNKNISTKVYNITGDDLNKLFKHWADKTGNYNSPLIGTGDDWVKACEEVGLDPLTMIGICGEETGRGGFKAMQWMSMKNYVGMRYIDPTGDGTGASVFWGGKNDVFATNYDAILASAKRIKNFYGAQYGGTTMQKLAHTGYTGHSDSKGESATNDYFANMWASIMKESLDYITGTNGGV